MDDGYTESQVRRVKRFQCERSQLIICVCTRRGEETDVYSEQQWENVQRGEECDRDGFVPCGQYQEGASSNLENRCGMSGV